MKSAELFAVLLKVMGVGEIVTGLKASPLFVGQFWQAEWNDDAEFVAFMIATMLSSTGIHILSGCALFFGADWLTTKIYKKREPPNDSEFAGA